VKRFSADLHIHTALSHCAEDAMTPRAIVDAAVRVGLHMIAICDHNSTRNVAAVQEAAGNALCFIPGIEITSAEEAHVLGLFPDAASAGCVGEAVREGFPETTPTLKRFGRQLWMDASGRVIGEEAKMLGLSSRYPLSGAVALIHRHGGLAVASHVDRSSNSVVSQLGFFPEDVAFDAIEISAEGWRQGRAGEFASLGLPIITSSDSHFLSDFGSACTIFEMRQATFVELARALRNEGGRRCHLA
jgi:PHP family Zn ribbon phosphoesterase